MLCSLVCLLLFSLGCQEADKTVIENQMENNLDEGDTVDIDDNTILIETEEGGKIESNIQNEDEWCGAGSTWSMTGSEGDAEMVVEGIVNSGKYAGYCHITYDVDSEDTQANIDYYFDEDGNGYQVMVINGQTFESEWTG